MTRSSSLFGPSVAAVLALSLAACGPKPPQAAQSSESAPAVAETTPAAQPASQSQQAPASDAAAASDEAPSAAAPAAAPLLPAPPGMVALQIRTASGTAVFGNPDNGRQVFVVCSACHSLQAGQNMVGPSLHGIVGRHSGQVAGFHYSSANKASGLVWSEQELYAYLENPQKAVPGTYMTYTGVKDPQQRADLIAYLQQSAK